MVYEYALLTTAPERSVEFEASFPEAIAILRSSPGCQDIELQASVDKPGLYLLKVRWSRIEDHLITFAESPAAERLGGVFGRFFTEPPVVAHFEK